MQSASFVDALLTLPIIVDSPTTDRAMHSIYVLAADSDLTIYDAAYLELAIRERVPLYSVDKNLIKAARKWGIATE